MENNTQNKLTLKHIIGYGAGDAGGVVTLIAVVTYLNRYVTNVLGISFGTLATLLFIWNMWDMINDPLMGTLMDKAFEKHHGSKDKFRPWILRSIPLICIGLIAYYFVPSKFGGWGTLITVFLLKIVYEFGYTMVNIAMGSLLGVMATNDEERTTLASARGIGSTVGIFISSYTVPKILARFGETSQGYFYVGLFAAAVGGFLIFLHYALTEERKVDPVEVEKEEEKVKFTDIFVTLKKNRAFLALCIHSIAIVFSSGLAGATLPYIAADHYNAIGALSTGALVNTIMQLVLLFSSPFLVRIFKSTVNLIRVYLIISIALFVGLFFTLKGGQIPAMVYVIWLSVANGIGQMSVQLQWGLVSESIDYNEYITGKRSEGSIYGNFSLTRRLGQLFSSSAIAWMIGAIGYNIEAAKQGVKQSAETISSLITINTLVPALITVISLLSFTFIWNINDELRQKIANFNKSKLETNEE